jgi:hypothetical protein
MTPQQSDENFRVHYADKVQISNPFQQQAALKAATEPEPKRQLVEIKTPAFDVAPYVHATVWRKIIKDSGATVATASELETLRRCKRSTTAGKRSCPLARRMSTVSVPKNGRPM